MKATLAIAALAISFFSSTALADGVKIDGTSDETFSSSVKAMTQGLSPDEKAIFQKGLLNLIIIRYPPAEGAEGLALLAFMPQAVKAANTTMNGVSKDEILRHGRELESKDTIIKIDYSAVRYCLQRNVIISNARIERTNYGFDITLAVTNKLPWAISFVHIGYKVTTPGRSVPWSDENFGMSVSGGIEPGETRSITTNAFGIPDIAKDLRAEAQILDVADAQKRHLVGEVVFSNNSHQLTPNGCK